MQNEIKITFSSGIFIDGALINVIDLEFLQHMIRLIKWLIKRGEKMEENFTEMILLYATEAIMTCLYAPILLPICIIVFLLLD